MVGGSGSRVLIPLVDFETLSGDFLMLLSSIITLRASQPAALPADLGRAAHAWFLALVQRADPALAAQLHEPNALRPFTVSNLRGVERSRDGQITLQAGQAAWLRVTSFAPQLSRLLLEQIIPALGGAITLGEAEFAIQGATCDPQQHPWAGQATFEALAQEHLLGSRQPPRKLTLHFATPTSFRGTGGETTLADGQGRAYRVAGYTVLLPLPGLVFDSYLQRWNAFAPLSLHPDLKRYAEECVTISRYELRTVLVEYGAQQQAGFIGHCQFIALVHDPYWLRLLNLLAAFAFYCGTGQHTSMGMGQTRQGNHR